MAMSSPPLFQLATGLIETGDANSLRLGIGHLFSAMLERERAVPTDSSSLPSDDYLDGVMTTASHVLREFEIQKGLN